MTRSIDLKFRPGTYFQPRALPEFLLAQVKGAVVRKRLSRLYDEGKHEELESMLSDLGIVKEVSHELESVHPAFMGGNYLPEFDDGEVEVARICINSTTGDVTSVYARAEQGRIGIRVVDEYDGDTLQGDASRVTDAPLSLGEFIDFFLGAWDLFAVLRMNFGDDLNAALRFFEAESGFYPDLDAAIRDQVVQHYDE